MLNLDDWLGLFDDAQEAIVAFLERLRMATVPRVDRTLEETQRLVSMVHNSFLPELGLTADDARRALEQAAGLIGEVRSGHWIEAHVETEHAKYHIKIRLEPEGEKQ